MEIEILHILFHTKTLKSILYFTFRVHVSLGSPYFRRSTNSCIWLAVLDSAALE